jgi:uncharacterized protein
MNITITGATGLIGKRLSELLASEGHSVCSLSRAAPREAGRFTEAFSWDAEKGPPPEEALARADAVVHLAGETISQRWTPEAKRRIRESRENGTRRLIEGLSTLSRRPAVLVSGSAVGFYGSRGDEILTEDAPPGEGFLAQVCVDWENQAILGESLGMRVVRLRTGMVLSPNGGALARMLPPFKAGLGGRLGSGNQWMSWIHLEDLVRLIRFLLEQPVAGPVNATAPNPVTNAAFTRMLAGTLRRPALFPVPRFALRILFGEMAGILLDSQRVIPEVARAAGFHFEYPEVEAALANLLVR